MEVLFSGSLKELVCDCAEWSGDCDCAEWSFWENYCTFVELVLEGPWIKDLESNNWTLGVTFWGLRFGQGVKKHSGEDSCSLFPVNSGTTSELLSYMVEGRGRTLQCVTLTKPRVDACVRIGFSRCE